ncbi:methyltransferase domain-containing protein [Apiospora kogelbergensis]|uniref:methyltransferase domain-containing protein n=1 Tax=Apiospora kogelbergensis TaxID=1337665 RepID=UPI00313255A5
MTSQDAHSKPVQDATADAPAIVIREPTDPHPGDKHEIPDYETHGTFDSLKDRIKLHYNVASDYYYSLWGQHIHHGYWKSGNETKEEAQVNLINLLLEISALPKSSRVLDVGCGIGGTSRFLAKEHDCQVTGITISGRQVEIARRLTLAEVDGGVAGDDATKAETAATDAVSKNQGSVIKYPTGNSSVRFIELDAEKMLEHFKQQDGNDGPGSFDGVWISEALSHFPNKPLFFSSAFELLQGGSGNASRLVIADWFKAKDLTPEQEVADIKAIEDGMLLPPLCTADQYVEMATKAGFKVLKGPMDISADVSKTWDISWSLVSSPSLWAFAISQGRDGLAFLQAFRAMRRGYANGTFKYCCIAFEKP